jgi:hypothetical protein
LFFISYTSSKLHIFEGLKNQPLYDIVYTSFSLLTADQRSADNTAHLAKQVFTLTWYFIHTVVEISFGCPEFFFKKK